MGEYLSWSDENQNQSLSIHLAKLMKVRQIIANEKLNHTKELINDILEQDKKIIVFTNFTAPLMELAQEYKKKLCFTIWSNVSRTKTKKCRYFSKGP